MPGEQGKPLNKLTDREWRGTCIAFTFIGVLVLVMGIKDADWGMIKIGLVFLGFGVAGGLVLHFVFGIRIIQLRKDFKHPKY